MFLKQIYKDFSDYKPEERKKQHQMHRMSDFRMNGGWVSRSDVSKPAFIRRSPDFDTGFGMPSATQPKSPTQSALVSSSDLEKSNNLAISDELSYSTNCANSTQWLCRSQNFMLSGTRGRRLTISLLAWYNPSANRVEPYSSGHFRHLLAASVS